MKKAICLLFLFALPIVLRAVPPKKVPILVDTDIGTDIDDAFALVLITRSPELELLGVTTVSGDTHARARLAAKLLWEAGLRRLAAAGGTGAGAAAIPHIVQYPPSMVPPQPGCVQVVAVAVIAPASARRAPGSPAGSPSPQPTRPSGRTGRSRAGPGPAGNAR